MINFGFPIHYGIGVSFLISFDFISMLKNGDIKQLQKSSGDKSSQHKVVTSKDIIPKGCLPIKVGHGKEQYKIVVHF